jgi:hypothetical protein
MSCGIVFVPGESYLLFVSGANSINHGASGMLTQNGARTMAHRDTLAILRAYRDGKIDDLVVDDLPEAWTFLDSSLACELQHSAGLTFSYPYVDNYHRYAYSVEYDEKGYATTFAGGPVDPAATDIEVIVEGPNLETHGLVFAARLDVGVSPIPDSATIRVGRRSWRLTTHTMTLRFRGIATAPSVETVIPPSVSDVATDEEAREILQAMLEPQIVVVRKAWTDSEPGRNVQDVAVELRTDHISAEAAKFLACMDGSVRSQPIREGNQ